MLKEVFQSREQINIDDNFSKISKHNSSNNNLNKSSAKQNSTDKLFCLEQEILRILLNYGNEQLIFDQEKISAAHKTLPLPSIVKVTNITNQKFIYLSFPK